MASATSCNDGCSGSKISTHRVSAQTCVQAHAPTFRYTLDNNKLTYAQRQFYEENGYLVIPRLFREDQLDEYVQRFVDVCERRVPRGRMILMRDIADMKNECCGANSFFRLQDIAFDDVLSKYCLNPQLLDYVECFTGPHITARQSMVINKPPDTGSLSSRHPTHQDLWYFPFRPADRIVAAWTAMVKVTPENGGLYVFPGTHKGTLFKHEYPKWEGGVNKAFHGIPDYEGCPKNLNMEKGDTVFFHPLLIHGSGPNLTKTHRKAITCHYSCTECSFVDVMGTIQEPVAKEIMDMDVQRGLCGMNYEDTWKYRARHVRGPRAML